MSSTVSLQEFPAFEQVVNVRLTKATDELAAEFAGIYDRDRVAAIMHESVEQLSEGEVAAFVPVLAQRFARERLRALAQADGHLEKPAPEILFVSLSGGGRAQIGAALLERRLGAAAHAHTAGSERGGTLDPNVVTAMAEIGIDLSGEFTKPLSLEVMAAADIVVTMGRSVGAVGIPPNTRHVDWRVGDPSGADLDEVRRVCDDIGRRVEALAEELKI